MVHWGIRRLHGPHVMLLSSQASRAVSRVTQTMLTNTQSWGSCGFSPQTTRMLLLFVVAVQMQQGLLGCQNHVKSICTYKGRPIDINDAASSTECRKCAFEPVCAFERASVSEVRVTHTCFPVGWIWWRPQGTEQTDSSESSSEGVRYPRLHRCSCQARLATMMGSRWTESASETQNRWFCCVLNNLGSIVCPPRSVVGAIYLGFGILFRIYRGVALNIFNP